MQCAMDLNNEKIQMRKEIKRAKVWVTSKLVRQIRNLQNKKGNDVMITKNKRRAQRLEEELDIIKDMKPDDVFKQLINSNTDAKTLESQHTLQERALIRIGSVSFIKNKMTDIKSNVSAFHLVRSGKDISPVNTELNDAVHQHESTLSENTVEESISENHRKRINSLTTDSETSCDNHVSDEASRNDHVSDEVINKNTASVNKEVASSDRDDTCVHDSDKDESLSELNKTEAIAETQNFSKHTPIEVEDKTELKPDFQEITQGFDDITHVLTNIGERFDSDDSSIGSDIELKDLENPGGKDDSSTKVQDMFFLNWAGVVNKKYEGGSKAGAAHLSHYEELKQVKSCFVQSLASISHQRNKGKNRPSQRPRRRLATKNDKNTKSNEIKAKTCQTFVKKASTQPHKKSQAKELAPLHPSWEASRKRKQEQKQLHGFTGKRVCFDDSD